MTNPPRPGYWLANDGKWYPPELHPDRIRQRLAAERDQANAALGATAPPATQPGEDTSATQPEATLASPMQHPSVPPLDDELEGPTDDELREIESLEDQDAAAPDEILTDETLTDETITDETITDAPELAVDPNPSVEPADQAPSGHAELPEDAEVVKSDTSATSRWDRKGEDVESTTVAATDPAISVEIDSDGLPAQSNTVPLSPTPSPSAAPNEPIVASVDQVQDVTGVPDATFSPPDAASVATPEIQELADIPELAEIPELPKAEAPVIPPAPPDPIPAPPLGADASATSASTSPSTTPAAAISSANAPPDGPSPQTRAPIPEPFPEASADDLVEAEPQKSFIRRWWLPVLLVAGALALVNFVIMPYIDTDRTSADDDSELNVFELATGTCIDEVDLDVQTELKGTVERVPCTAPHSHEIFHTVSHPEGTFDSTLIRDFATDECLAMFETYTGEFYSLSQLKFILLLPNEKAWDKGDRTTICALFGDGPLTESARS